MYIIKNDGRFTHDIIHCSSEESAVKRSLKCFKDSYIIEDVEGNLYYVTRGKLKMKDRSLKTLKRI